MDVGYGLPLISCTAYEQQLAAFKRLAVGVSLPASSPRIMRIVSSAELSYRQTRRLHSGPVLHLLGSGRGASFSVSVLYLSGNMSEHAHPSGTLASSSLGLDRPIIAANFATLCASRSVMRLLLVPVLLATEAGERV